MWHIGQDIVCIKTSNKKTVKEGEVYIIKGLKKWCCGTIAIDIGRIGNFELEKCCKCQRVWKATDNKHWYNENLFKPLDELSDISELLEVLELETV